MGDVFEAYAFLNKSMNLGLSAMDLMRMEAGFKSAFAAVSNPTAAKEGDKLTENWELKTMLVRRTTPMTTAQLSQMAVLAASSLRYQPMSAQNIATQKVRESNFRGLQG